MSRLMNFIDLLFTRRRWAVHSLFWVFVLVLYVIFFGQQVPRFSQTLFFVGLLMPVTMGTSYFLNYFLIPRFLLKERYFFFLLYLLYTLLAAVFLEMVAVVITFVLMAELQVSNMGAGTINIFFLLAALLMVIFLAVSIKLLLGWRKSKEDYQKILLEKVEAELKFLKIQLNPHFLFNTLNNLYYLSCEKSDEAPRAILALSELLDYVMSGTKVRMVPLEAELKQLRNLIALESLRYDNERLLIKFQTSGDSMRAYICPMILITLVENAFKHGVMPVAGKAWINIDVQSSAEGIQVRVGNSKGAAKSGAHSKGTGLNNIRNQLQLLYQDRYCLEIQNHHDCFLVNLTLHEVQFSTY